MQKTIVSDTSCIGYLIQINRLDLLQMLYGEIIIPTGVFEEVLQLEERGYLLSEFKNASWISIQKPMDLSNVRDYKHLLHKGELQAISLAIELNADLLIIDEKIGRIVAANIGFDITGLVGILITAKNMNLIASVKENLDKVILSGCRISEKLYNIALKSCNEH